jgi:hypothetical protein
VQEAKACGQSAGCPASVRLAASVLYTLYCTPIDILDALHWRLEAPAAPSPPSSLPLISLPHPLPRVTQVRRLEDQLRALAEVVQVCACACACACMCDQLRALAEVVQVPARPVPNARAVDDDARQPLERRGERAARASGLVRAAAASPAGPRDPRVTLVPSIRVPSLLFAPSRCRAPPIRAGA